jgi:arginyl-tRNA synthetase
VWRQVAERNIPESEADLLDADLSPLVEPAELDLIRLMSQYPEVVEGAALHHEPHRLPFYLMDLAGAFHPYYNGHRILLDEDQAPVRRARLALITAVRQIIANGLRLLCVEARDHM